MEKHLYVCLFQFCPAFHSFHHFNWTSLLFCSPFLHSFYCTLSLVFLSSFSPSLLPTSLPYYFPSFPTPFLFFIPPQSPSSFFLPCILPFFYFFILSLLHSFSCHCIIIDCEDLPQVLFQYIRSEKETLLTSVYAAIGWLTNWYLSSENYNL